MAGALEYRALEPSGSSWIIHLHISIFSSSFQTRRSSWVPHEVACAMSSQRSKANGATEHAFSNVVGNSSGDTMPSQNSNVTITLRSRSGAPEHAFSERFQHLTQCNPARMPSRNSSERSLSSEEQLALEASYAQLYAKFTASVATQMANHLPSPADPPAQTASGAPEHAASIQLTTFDMNTLDIIICFCAVNLEAQHNGIAATNRYLNIAWRRMHRIAARNMMHQLLTLVKHTAQHPTTHPTLCAHIIQFACEDLNDILFPSQKLYVSEDFLFLEWLSHQCEDLD